MENPVKPNCRTPLRKTTQEEIYTSKWMTYRKFFILLWDKNNNKLIKGKW